MTKPDNTLYHANVVTLFLPQVTPRATAAQDGRLTRIPVESNQPDPAFHDVVRKTGSVPLDVSGQVIDRWIALRKRP